MDIIIFGGQSTMQGQTSYVPEDIRPITGGLEFRLSENGYIPLHHPVGEDIDNHLKAACYGYGSLVPDFVDVYRKYRNVTVGAVHAAKGATKIEQWDPAGERYGVAKSKIAASLENAPEPIEHKYYIWLQGESDAIFDTTEEVYLERLIAYKNALKADFGIEKFGIIRVGYFCYDDPKKDEIIMRAQERACLLDEDLLMLTRITAQLSYDERYLNPHASGHYDNQGLAVIAAESARTLAMYAMGLRAEQKTFL